MRLPISNGSEENKMEIRKGALEYTVIVRTTNDRETTRLIKALMASNTAGALAQPQFESMQLRSQLWVSNLVTAIKNVATGKSESVSFVDEE